MNDPKSILEPIGGYVLDCAAKLRNDLFVPHSLTKLHNIWRCKKLSGATSAVEVGSYKGLTTRRLSYLFDRVYSIEIDEALCEIARKRCAGRSNVEIFLGDGSKLLGEIAPRVSCGLIFLDGHFSGGETGHGDEPEPVLKELDIIESHIGNFVSVVIDDFRLFGIQDGWPHKSEVMLKLERLFPSPQWMVTVNNDQFLVIRRPQNGVPTAA